MAGQRKPRLPSPEYLGDYVWASLWSTGDILARVFNFLSLIGIGLIILIAIVFQVDPASLAIAFIAFVLLIILTHYGSFVAYQSERRHRKELEAAAKPRLALECHQLRGITLGGLNESRSSLAYLTVRNTGAGQIRNAFVKVAEIIEHAPGSGTKPYRTRLYKHQDVFLKWEATEDRLLNFATSANVRVAYGRNGDGNYRLVTAGGVRLTPTLRSFENYEMVVEVSADEIAVLREKLLLRMEEPRTVDENGVTTLWIDSPLTVEFRKWTKADAVEDEFDLDEWQERNLR